MKLLQRGAIKENNAAIKAGMSFLTASEYHIERVNDLSDDAGGSIESTKTVTTEDGKPKVEGTYKVEEGYTGRVRYRWLEPSQDHYLIAYANLDEENGKFSFIPPAKDVFVELLTTKEAGAAGVQAGRENGGVQNVNDIIEGATGGVKKSADEQSKAGDVVLTFNVGKTGDGYNFGALLTKQCDEDGNSVLPTSAGNTVEIVANPIKNYTVAGDTITARYYVSGDRYAKIIQIKPNASGVYVLKVPADIVSKKGIEVMATFQKIEHADDTNLHNYQVSGTAGLAVVINHGAADIGQYTDVKAASDVDAQSTQQTRVLTTADGTAISEQDIELSKNAAQRAHEVKSQKVHEEFTVKGAKNALHLTATSGGKVEQVANGGIEDGIHYSFVAKPGSGNAVGGVYVTYFQGKTVKTIELQPQGDQDGGKLYKLDLTELGEIGTSTVDKGMPVSVGFEFVDAEGNAVSGSDFTDKYIVRNPISIRTNVLNESNEKDAAHYGFTRIGDVTFVEEKDGEYWFRVVPREDEGYTIDPTNPDAQHPERSNAKVLFVSYVDGAGVTRRAPMMRDPTGTRGSEYWYFKPATLAAPAGAVISVNATFTPHVYEVKAVDNKDADLNHGKVMLSASSLKKGDTLTITAAPDTDYANAKEVTVRYYRGGKAEEVQVPLDAQGVGTFTFKKDMHPNDLQGFEVVAAFREKNVELYNLSPSGSVSMTASRVSLGESVAIDLSQDKLNEGYKLTQITLTASDGKRTAKVPVSNGRFVVPADWTGVTGIKVFVEAADMAPREIPIEGKSVNASVGEGGERVGGKLTPTVGRADRGETVNVQITPMSGCRVQTGTAYAVVTVGEEEFQVPLERISDTVWQFQVPTTIDDIDNASITLTADFEAGKDKFTSGSFSVGAALGVHWVDAENYARVLYEADVTAKNVRLAARGSGTDTLTVKAGYNQSDVGIAGAIAVQVSGFDTQAKVDKFSKLNLTDGSRLDVAARNGLTFALTADASGQRQQGASVGVGAGIAVAVRGADVLAQVDEGVVMDAPKDATFGDFNIDARQAVAETVTARAGSAGGVSVTPVAAVDVFGSSAQARMGDVKVSGKFGVPIRVKSIAVRAVNDARHTILANATAAGKSVGLGGAFGISIVGDSANADLFQSLNATGDVTVNGKAKSTLYNTVVSGAAGGVKGKSNATGASGSADRQANQMIAGASSISAGHKSANVSTAPAANRQKAQSTEGSVAGAAAMALNVMFNRSTAEVKDNVDIVAGGAVNVISENRGQATLKANASATRSDVGVGAGVAVNALTIENTATVEDGAITAASLDVIAKMTDSTGSKVTAEQRYANPQTTDAFVREIHDFIMDVKTPESEEQFLSGELIATFDSVFAASFLEQTGLDQVLGEGTIEEKIERATDMFDKALERLENLPKALLEPLRLMYDDLQDTLDMSREDWEDALESVANELIHWLPSESVHVIKELVMSVCVNVAGQGLDYVSDRLRDLEKPTWKDFKSGGIKAVKDAVKTVLNVFVTDLVEETMTLLSAQVPLLTQDRLNVLLNQLPETPSGAADSCVLIAKWAKSEDKWDELGGAVESKSQQLLDGIVDNILDTIKTNVFDYEAALGKIYDTDVVKMMKDALVMIKDSLKESLKESEVAAVNKAISMISEGLNLQLEPEGLTDKHVANTQAVSGAGAENVGIAGSLALTVFNANTIARITSSDRAVNVTGATNIKASEIRRLTNNASAAVDPDGNAATNERAAGKKSADVGTSAGTMIEDKEKNLTVKADAGGSVAFDPAKPEQVIITLEDGYRLKDDQRVHYEDEKGSSDKNILMLEKLSDKTWRIKCNDSKEYGKYMLVNVEFEEVLTDLPDPRATVTGSKTQLPADPVNLSVEDREKENGKWSARKGDVVLVTAKNVEGLAIAGVSYTVQNTDGTTEKVLVSHILTSNAQQTVYQFTVRDDSEITSIDVEYVESAAGQANHTATQSRDESGKSVGVGASFAMILGLSDVKAELGYNRRTAVGALEVSATSDHQEKINAVAGTDPLQSGRKGPTNVKDISVDAAVALNLLDNDIEARIDENGKVSVDGYTDKNGVQKAGNLTMKAEEKDLTWIRSSGFSTGDNVAVGASAALNLGFTDVQAIMDTNAAVSGAANIAAKSHSEDKTSAMATAMGSDIQRYLDKFARAEQVTQEVAQSVADGSMFDKIDKALFKGTNTNNSTADKVNKRLDDTGSGGKADKTQSTSTNAMKSQDVKTADASGAKGATDTAGKEIKDGTGKDVATSRDTGESTKMQVAAALGMTLTRHVVQSTVNGNLNVGGAASVTAGNTTNYNTLGTGVAMSLAKKSNAIAAAAAVSASRNKALVTVNGDLLADQSGNGGDLTLGAELTQNQDGQYRGLLASQALAGSVAGADSAVSIAGAISLVLSEAAADVQVTGSNRHLSGDKIAITANDKSRLSARAGGLSISKGSAVGMGLAATTLVSADTVNASVADGASIIGNALEVTAAKQAVTFDDYQFPLSLKNVASDSSKLTPDQRQNVETGIIDVHRGGGEDNYTIDINVRSSDVLKLFDALSFLSSTNYYAEAIAGSISAGRDGGKLSAAGSAAFTAFNNKVNASLGDNVSVKLTKKDENYHSDMKLSASTDTNARLIAGAISAGTAKVSGGIGVGIVNDNDTATAKLGNGVNVSAEGDVNVDASADGSIQVFNAAVSVAAGTNAEAAVGGSMNVIHDKHAAKALVGDKANVTSGGAMNVKALTDMDLITVTASANGVGGKVAAGGTIQVVVNEGESQVKLGDSHNLKSTGDASIAAIMREQLIAASASASVATQSSGASVAGNVATLVSLTKANVDVGGGKGGIESSNGSVVMDADSDTRIINAMVSAAGGAGVTVGANVGVGVFGRQANLTLAGAKTPADYAIRAKEDVVARSRATDTIVNAGLALSAGIGQAAISGTFITDVSRSKVRTTVDNGVHVTADNNAAFDAYHSGLQVLVGGAASVTTGAAGVGAAIVNLIHKNDVQTSMGNSVVEAKASGDALNVRAKADVSGAHVGAKVAETQVIVGFGAAGGGTAGVTGTLATATAANVVRAKADAASLKALDISGAKADTGNVSVIAENDVSQGVAAGGVNGAGSVAVGASAVSQANKNTAEALAGDITARNNAAVNADSKEVYALVAANIGGAGTVAVEVGVAVQVLMNNVRAIQSGNAVAGGDYSLTAKQDVNAVDVFTAIAGSGVAAVTPVVAVTYAQGETEATLEKDASLTLKNANKTAQIFAASDNDIYEYIVGGAGSGTAAVSGSIAATVSLEKVAALAKEGSTATLNGSDLEVRARNNYAMQSVTAAISASGVAAVAVNAAINVMMDSTTAALDGKVVGAKDVRVKADSERDAVGVVANVNGSGIASVGVSVVAFAAGTHMSQDAADMLMYGNASDKSGSTKTFEASAFLSAAKDEGIDTTDIENLGEYMKGDGHYHTEASVGKAGADFDATSGVLSEDFNKQNFIDQDEEVQRGENFQPSDSDDVANARAVDTYTYKSSPGDALIARIGSTADVAAKNVTVDADQNTRADMYGAAISGAAYAGVGVSTADIVLFSNVLASATGKLALDDGDLTVAATSRSGKVYSGDSEEEQARADALKKSLGGALNPVNRSLRTVALTAGGGIAGVGVSAAIVLTDNKTKALLGGTATGVRNLNVKGSAAYTDVLSASVAAGIGVAGVAGAIGVALANGDVDAIIDSGARVTRSSAIGESNYSITSNTGYAVNAYCATVSGGVVGVNAGLAVAGNRLNQNALIMDGASIDKAGSGKLTVKGVSDTSVISGILGANCSGIAVAPVAAVSIAAPRLNTGIGTEEGKASVIAPDTDIEVANDTKVVARPEIANVTSSSVAVSGNLLLSFVDPQATAAVRNTAMKAKSLDIAAKMNAEAQAALLSATYTGINLGLSTAYADLSGYNRAVLDISDDMSFAGDVSVSAGTDGNRNASNATAVTLAVGMSMISVSANAAVARNRLESSAKIAGAKAPLTTTGDRNITVQAAQNAKAFAEVIGCDVGVANVSPSVAVSMIEGEQSAQLELAGLPETTASDGNALRWGKLSILSALTADNEAKLLTGGGSIAGVRANVAVAYGRAKSRAEGTLRGETFLSDSVDVVNRASDSTRSNIDNQVFSVIAANAMVGTAYSQDEFTAKLNLNMGGAKLSAGKAINVTNDYSTQTVADVTPSASGVSASMATLDVNVAVAKASATVDAALSGHADLWTDGVTVRTSGYGDTRSQIKTPNLVISSVSVNPNVAYARNITRQTATLSGISDTALVRLCKAGPVSVISETDRDRHATKTVLGGSGWGKSDTKVHLVAHEARVNVARALDEVNAIATAQRLASQLNEGENNGPGLRIQSGGVTSADANTGTANVVQAAGIGVNDVLAKAAGTFKARLLNPGELQVDELRTTVDYTAKANAAVGASPLQGSLLVSVQYDKAAAEVSADAEALVDNTSGSGSLKTANIYVQTTGNLDAYAEGETPTVSIDMGSVMAHHVNSDVKASQSARLLNGAGSIAALGHFSPTGEMTGGGTVSVLSRVNTSKSRAVVSSPANATSVTLVGGQASAAVARHAVSSVAEIGSNNAGGRISTGGSVTVSSESGDLLSESESRTPTQAGVFTAGALVSRALMADRFITRTTGGKIDSGALDIGVRLNTSAHALGSAPGAYTVGTASGSLTDTQIGEENARQTAIVEIAGQLNTTDTKIHAENVSSAKSEMGKKTQFTLSNVTLSEIPTTTWLETGVHVKDGASLYASGETTIESSDRSTADSRLKESTLSLVFNVETMHGDNTVDTVNNITFGKGMSVQSGRDINIKGRSDTIMNALSVYDGGFSLWTNDSDVYVTNTLKRRLKVAIGDESLFKSERGSLNVEARSGEHDSIYTAAYISSSAMINTTPGAKAYLDIDSDTTVSVGGKGTIQAQKDVTLHSDASLGEIVMEITSDAGGSLTSSARAENHATINNAAKLLLNPDRVDTLQITSRDKDVNLLASSEDVYVDIDAYGYASNAGGKVNAWSLLTMNMLKHVYIDNTTVNAENGTAKVRAYNSDKTRTIGGKTLSGNILMLNAYAKMTGVGIGYVAPKAIVEGSWINEIRSMEDNGGHNVILNGRNVTKVAESPEKNLDILLWTDYDKTFLAGNRRESKNNLSYGNQNDLLTKTAYKVGTGKVASSDGTGMSVSIDGPVKVLGGLFGASTENDTVEGMWRSHSLVKCTRDPSEIYVLDLIVPLTRDVRMALPARYMLWRNTQTQMDVFLLPNATRLNVRGNRVRIVQELMRLIVGGKQRLVNILVSLQSENAGKQVGLSNRSTLDFDTGSLRVPEGESFWVYTRELSGKWLAGQFESGNFRLYDVDRERLAAWSADQPLPEAEPIEGLTPVDHDGDAKWYWIGVTPDTARDSNAALYLLAVDASTDEASLWRTTAGVVAGGLKGEPADFAAPQRAFAFRDLRADHEADSVRYDVLLLDLDAAHEESTFEIMTDLPDSDEPKRPAPIYVVLRPFPLDGVDAPCYSIRGVLFAWLDASDGAVDLLDGQYTATNSDTTFDSPYTRIEGNGTEALQVIIKSGQPIWPEWLSDSSAGDLQGNRYELREGEWVQVDAAAVGIST